jgi:hypothetical protein
MEDLLVTNVKVLLGSFLFKCVEALNEVRGNVGKTKVEPIHDKLHGTALKRKPNLTVNPHCRLLETRKDNGLHHVQPDARQGIPVGL